MCDPASYGMNEGSDKSDPVPLARRWLLYGLSFAETFAFVYGLQSSSFISDIFPLLLKVVGESRMTRPSSPLRFFFSYPNLKFNVLPALMWNYQRMIFKRFIASGVASGFVMLGAMAVERADTEANHGGSSHQGAEVLNNSKRYSFGMFLLNSFFWFQFYPLVQKFALSREPTSRFLLYLLRAPVGLLRASARIGRGTAGAELGTGASTNRACESEDVQMHDPEDYERLLSAAAMDYAAAVLGESSPNPGGHVSEVASPSLPGHVLRVVVQTNIIHYISGIIADNIPFFTEYYRFPMVWRRTLRNQISSAIRGLLVIASNIAIRTLGVHLGVKGCLLGSSLSLRLFPPRAVGSGSSISYTTLCICAFYSEHALSLLSSSLVARYIRMLDDTLYERVLLRMLPKNELEAEYEEELLRRHQEQMEEQEAHSRVRSLNSGEGDCGPHNQRDLYALLEFGKSSKAEGVNGSGSVLSDDNKSNEGRPDANDCHARQAQAARPLIDISKITEDDIRRQYRRLALRYHPDKLAHMGGRDAAAKQQCIDHFKAISEAHRILSNKALRAVYDAEYYTCHRSGANELHPTEMNAYMNRFFSHLLHFNIKPGQPKDRKEVATQLAMGLATSYLLLGFLYCSCSTLLEDLSRPGAGLLAESIGASHLAGL